VGIQKGFVIKDRLKPGWKSFVYPARVNAERDMGLHQAQDHANGTKTADLYIEEHPRSSSRQFE
jgi:hypothetical protein